jgi:hypothetical protein
VILHELFLSKFPFYFHD